MMFRGFAKILGVPAVIGLILCGSALALAGLTLDQAKSTGIETSKYGNAWVWKGPGGATKPNGPLVGKRIGVIAASELIASQTFLRGESGCEPSPKLLMAPFFFAKSRQKLSQGVNALSGP